jgi:hypothetical protein
MIKKIFGSYTKFVFFAKCTLATLAALLILYIVLIVNYGSDLGKIKLLNSKKDSSHPLLEIINSKISGIKFLNYKFEIYSDSIEKNNKEVFILNNLNAKILSKTAPEINLKTPIAIYDEKNGFAHLQNHIDISYDKYHSTMTDILLDLKNNVAHTKEKFVTYSDEMYFESLNGFTMNQIDFSKIDFSGPIKINYKPKNGKKISNLTSDTMTIFYNVKTKMLEQAYNYGNVKFKNDNFNISSDKAIYIANDDTLVFEDNLVIINNGNILYGKKFIYNIAKEQGQIVADKSNKKRVEIVLDGSKK